MSNQHEIVVKNESKTSNQDRTKSDMLSFKPEMQKINFESIPDQDKNH
jgi:hypothetical protein